MWTNLGHHTYGVITETITTVQSRAILTSEFSVPAGTDFYVIGNYAATNLSVSTHVELFYSDIPGGTFRQRGLTVGGMNTTTAAIDNATVILLQDISTVNTFPRYKLKVPSGGGLVKFVVMWGKVPT